MREHTRMHRTEAVRKDRRTDDVPMPVDEMLRLIEKELDLPGAAICLRVLREREGLTQEALGKLLGIAQTNISQMECGRRQIGKNMAKRIAEVFHTDYRKFL